MRRPFSIQDWLRPLPNWRRACWVADSIATLKDSVLELADDFGERVMARDFDRQLAELQVRAAVLNRFTRLGTPMTIRIP